MIKKIQIILFVAIIIVFFWGCNEASPQKASENDTLSEDYLFLPQILRTEYKNDAFTVVDPMTNLFSLTIFDDDYVSSLAIELCDQIDVDADKIKSLIKRLIKRNETPVKLKLDSSLKDGYIVDYDGTFKKYLEEGGGGWEKWHKEHLKARSRTRVSLPVYDKNSGYVIVYKSIRIDKLAGNGYIILYKNSDGKLKELSRVMIWVS